jgi:hypothetical protein
MRHELAMEHARLSRRHALKLGAATAAVAAVGETFLPAAAGAEQDPDGDRGRGGSGGPGGSSGDYDDEMFDVEAVQAGAWAPSRYGEGDQRGAFNEITPETTARALRLLDTRKDVRTYQLGEEMFNGFPAYPSEPPRLHEMYLYVAGVQAPQEFVDGGGIQSSTTEPLGANQLTAMEERFAENFTFQIATQIDGLPHIGVGETYYNGFNIFDLLAPTGATALGNENMGPICTRAVILDIVGMKVAAGATDSFFEAPNGEPVLMPNYRITIDDIEHAMYRQRIRRDLRPGDVPIFHTGWTHLARPAPEDYLAAEPGIYLAEARYFADKRVAIVASDTWGLEVLDPTLTNGNAFPCHQELITQHGIRIGESFVTDTALADHVYEGVLVATPENVPGATCSSAAPMVMGQPGRAPRRLSGAGREAVAGGAEGPGSGGGPGPSSLARCSVARLDHCGQAVEHQLQAPLERRVGLDEVLSLPHQPGHHGVVGRLQELVHPGCHPSAPLVLAQAGAAPFVLLGRLLGGVAQHERLDHGQHVDHAVDVEVMAVERRQPGLGGLHRVGPEGVAAGHAGRPPGVSQSRCSEPSGPGGQIGAPSAGPRGQWDLAPHMIGHQVHQLVAAGDVAVERHRARAQSGRHLTHGHRLHPLGVGDGHASLSDPIVRQRGPPHLGGGSDLVPDLH